MMEAHTLVLFAAACVALAAMPGPDMLLIVSRSVSQGRAAGFASLAGIQLGVYCHATALAFGLSGLLLALPGAYDVIRIGGAGYLLYLAWKTIGSAPGLAAATTGLPRHGLWRVFRQGLLTNLLNPKIALFMLALLPQFVHRASGSVATQILLLATIFNLIGFVVNGLVIVMATRVARVFAGAGGSRKTSQYFLAAVFAGLAVRLALDDRR